jgi:hypothetical protein
MRSDPGRFTAGEGPGGRPSGKPLLAVESDRRCPQCDAWQPAVGNSARCSFCGAKFPWGHQPLGRNPIVNGLIRVAHAYRIWSLGVLAIALIQLLSVGDVPSLFFAFVVLCPFGTALGISFVARASTPWWIVAFLVLVDLGVILAPAHGILPWLNLFPRIPRTPSRILSWYVLVYVALQFIVLPPVVFVRSLRTARRGGRPLLSPWICVFGFLVWGLFVSIVVLVIVVETR